MDRFLDIIVPYHNNTNEMVIRLLNSVYQQVGVDRNQIGIIFINDCSNTTIDDCIFGNYVGLHIEHIFNDTNIGPGLSRQRGIEQSLAEYVSFVDADDLLYGPTALKSVFEFLSIEKPDVLLTHFFRYDPHNNSKSIMTYDDLLCLHGAFYNRLSLLNGGYRFNENILYYEDAYFCRITRYTMNVKFLDIPTYIWIVNYNGMGMVGNSNGLIIKKRILDFVNSNVDVIDFIYEKGKLTKEFYIRTLFDTYIVIESELFAGYDVSQLEDKLYLLFIKYREIFELADENIIKSCWIDSCSFVNKNYGISRIKREFKDFIVSREKNNNGKY